MDNLPPFVPEPDSPSQTEIVPSVLISTCQGWSEFAKWYWRLIGNQYRSPPELRRLALTIGNERETPMNRLLAAARWISREIGRREWEFGPYAFRPLSARSILSRMSADGKDRALLLSLWAWEYGLEAWPVLTRLRSRRYQPGGSADLSFPLLNNFNHSLAAIAGEDGRLSFLDASNPNRPPEMLPGQLSGSLAVIIRPDGGEIVEFPDIGSAACLWEEEADLIVDEDGSVLWEEEAAGTGAAAEILRARFAAPDSRTPAWETFLAAQCAPPTAAWTDFAESPQPSAPAVFSGRVRLGRLAVKRDGRALLRIPPLPGVISAGRGGFAFPLSLDAITMLGIRSQDLVLPHGFSITRRIRVRYPDDWRLLNPLSPFRRDYPFGTLSLVTNGSPGVLQIEFSVAVPLHRLAAGDFPAFREMASFCKRWMEPVLVWETP